MNKQDHINTVIGLYDKIAELENELEKTESQLEQARSMQQTYESLPVADAGTRDDCTAYFIAKGREAVYKNTINTWVSEVRFTDKEDGTRVFESKKKWMDRYVNDVPDVMSRVTFDRLFSDWLDRDYNKALEETKAKLEDSDD